MDKLLYLSDDDVQSQLATKYDLFVQIGPENLQYAIVDKDRRHVKVLADYEFAKPQDTSALIRLIEEHPESRRQFRYSFNSVKISVHTDGNMFLPADLVDSEHKGEYLKYLNPAGDGELLVNTLTAKDIQNLVSIAPDLTSSLNRIFQKPKIYSHATPLFEGSKTNIESDQGIQLFMDFQPGYFQAVVIRDSNLLFFNSFAVQNADEFNYYLLSILSTLELPTADMQVVLSGKISESDENYERISKYFNQIRFAETSGMISYPSEFETVVPHNFFCLFSLNVCE